MTDVGKWLRDGDPLADEPGLSAGDVEAMRRAVVAAARERGAFALWPQPLTIAATIALTLTAGAIVGRLMPPGGSSRSPHPSIAAPSDRSQPGERRQLQFATPGGTRVIWVFDSNFTL